MSENYHTDSFIERWHQLSLMEQMGNIGSEVGRALNWKSRGNTAHAENALARALELLDLTATDKRWLPHFYRLREIVRAREVLTDFFYGQNEYKSSAQSLERYFYNFAYAARRAL